jgi:hypothetical protein
MRKKEKEKKSRGMHKITQLNISKKRQKSKITYPKRAAQN